VSFLSPPGSAAWRHEGLRSGFEVVYFHPSEGGYRVEGCTTAIEDGQAWIADYEIRLDPTWTTRRASISSRSGAGRRTTVLEVDDQGRWRVDGAAAPHLSGCRDIDLESSAMTNALPVHRLALPVGGRDAPPAAYVRFRDLQVERLEQTYARVTDAADGGQRYDYTAPAFDFECRLVYDGSGLIVEYPGIAVRAG
jgi:hypothetical protein